MSSIPLERDLTSETSNPSGSSDQKIKKWQPDVSVVSSLKQEIIKLYKGKPKISDALITQYAKMAAFLQDRSAVIPYLKSLNKLLVAKGLERGLVVTNQKGESVLKPAIEGEDYPQQGKILHHVLEEELAKFGFQPKFIKINGLLPPSIFRETFRYGFLGKDPGTRSVPHGDFSHPIQLLMLAWQQKETGFLGDTALVDLYKSLGEDSAVYSHEPSEKILGYNYNESTLWSLIFDLVPGKKKREIFKSDEWNSYPFHFCSPEILNVFLNLTEEPELSFLRSLIIARETKRAKEATDGVLIDNKEKKTKVFPNTEYARSSLFSLELPKSFVDDEKNSAHPFIWKPRTKELKEKLSFFSDSVQKSHLTKILTANAMMESGNYNKAWDIYSKIYASINKDSTNASEKEVEKCLCYHLGILSAQKGKIASAEAYMDRALSIHEALEKDDQLFQGYKAYDVKKAAIVSALEIYQHLIRTKPDQIQRKEQESSCIIA